MDEQDVSVELFGRKYKNPLLMAPIGVQGIFHEDKEAGLAQVCEEVGVPYIMSTASTSTIEEVAAASNDGKVRLCESASVLISMAFANVYFKGRLDTI